MTETICKECGEGIMHCEYSPDDALERCETCDRHNRVCDFYFPSPNKHKWRAALKERTAHQHACPVWLAANTKSADE